MAGSENTETECQIQRNSGGQKGGRVKVCGTMEFKRRMRSQDGDPERRELVDRPGPCASGARAVNRPSCERIAIMASRQALSGAALRSEFPRPADLYPADHERRRMTFALPARTATGDSKPISAGRDGISGRECGAGFRPGEPRRSPRCAPRQEGHCMPQQNLWA